MRQEELRADVARLRVLRKATPPASSAHLAQALRLLRSVRTLGPEDWAELEQIRRHVDRLLEASAQASQEPELLRGNRDRAAGQCSVGYQCIPFLTSPPSGRLTALVRSHMQRPSACGPVL